MLPLAGAGIIGAANLAGGLIGNLTGQADRDKAAAARQAALQQWLNIHVPDPAQQAIALQHYKQTGQLTPELEQKFQQSNSELNNVIVDPTGRQAQINALTKLQDISSNNGLDAQARAQTQQAINTANANEKGQRDAIAQNFAQRGVGGAGAELAAKLQASQSDANRASQQGMDAAAAAQTRALQAMMSGATLGGNIRTADYQQKADAAKAQDMINAFNTKNSQTVANDNTNRMNEASKYNLGLQQDISNRNTAVDNTQEEKNKALYQQQFDNQTKIASGSSNASSGVANQDMDNANTNADRWAGIGGAIGQGTAAGLAYGNKKKDDEEEDSDEDYGSDEV